MSIKNYVDNESYTSLYPSLDQWSCPACSFDNSTISYPTCEMCHHTVSQIKSGPSILKQSWRCHSCARQNNANNIFCESCYQEKSSSDNHDLDINGRSFTSLIPRTTTTRNDQNSQINLETIHKQIIFRCKKFKTNFVDDQFVPSIQSLGSTDFKSVTQWLRIADISPSSDKDHHLPWTIISSPQPGDIEQGALGNCWLLAALALVTERPRILGKILITQTVNNEGIYLIRICHNGQWRTVIVDDCFPCTDRKKLVFSQARRRQLYVPLIEKACAKLFGSYAALTSGTMLESLQLLTGAPCDHINLQSSHSDTDIVWAKLFSACESNLLIGASSSRTDVTKEEYSQVRIHSNHAFSILAAHVLINCSTRFVLVRDPHARSNYTEEHVTPVVLAELRLINNTPRSSGAFWISWSTFLRFFSSITISNYNENHFDVRHEGQFTRSSTEETPTYRFRVTEPSAINISLVHHRQERNKRPSHTQSFVLCDIDEESEAGGIGQHVNILKSHRGGFTYWTGSLRPGNYVLIPFSISFWGQEATDNDYTLVIHSSIPIDLGIAPESPTLLADCLISALMKKHHTSTKGKEVKIYATSDERKPMLVVVENRSSSNSLSISTTMAQLNNIRYSRDSEVALDCIPPRHRQLIFIAEWTNEHRSSSYPAYDFDYEHITQKNHAKSIVRSDSDNLHTPRPY